MSKTQEETKVDQTIKKPTESGFEVFVKSLPFSSTTDEIEQYFASCGTVENVNLLRNRDGRPKGIGFVRFATKDQAQKAITLSGKEFGGRTLVIELAQPKSDRPEGEPRQPRVSSSIFVGNLSFTTTEGDLRKFFEGAGAIKAIRLATDRDGSSKGFAHIDFEEAESAQNAVKKSGSELDGRSLRVDFANPDRNGGGRGGFRGGRGGFRGSRGGFGGNRGGPREGGFREGGYRGDREGGFREGGFRGDREGGFRGDREGGFRGGRGGFGGSRGGPRRNDRD